MKRHCWVKDHILRTTTRGNRREKGAIPKDTRKDLTEDLVRILQTEGWDCFQWAKTSWKECFAWWQGNKENHHHHAWMCTLCSGTVKSHVVGEQGIPPQRRCKVEKKLRELCWDWIRGKFKCYAKDLTLTMPSSGTHSINVTERVNEAQNQLKILHS